MAIISATVTLASSFSLSSTSLNLHLLLPCASQPRLLSLSLTLLRLSSFRRLFFSVFFVVSPVILYCIISFSYKQICLPPHLASVFPPSCLFWLSYLAFLTSDLAWKPKIWENMVVNTLIKLTSTQQKYEESRIFFLRHCSAVRTINKLDF